MWWFTTACYVAGWIFLIYAFAMFIGLLIIRYCGIGSEPEDIE